MITDEYLDMLDEKEDSYLNSFLKKTVDEIVVCAICQITDRPMPSNAEYNKIDLGENSKNGRYVLLAHNKEEHFVHVEFSTDFKYAFVARRDFEAFEKLELDERTSKAAEKLFSKMREKLRDAALGAIGKDPQLIALSNFLAEERYGTNEYLIDEYKKCYQQVLDSIVEEIDNPQARSAIKEVLPVPDITDIRQFLSDNKIDADMVHVVE